MSNAGVTINIVTPPEASMDLNDWAQGASESPLFAVNEGWTPDLSDLAR